MKSLRARASSSIDPSKKRRATAHYQGLPRSGLRLQFYGMFHDRSSIPNVCRELAFGLRETVPELALHSYIRGRIADRQLRDLSGIDRQAPLCFFYGIPDLIDDPVWSHPTRIVGLACETDRIPPLWVEACNRFDLAIVPSSYCARSLRDSGVRAPILVVPHGLEKCYRPIGVKRRARPFVFYNVVNSDRPYRKSLPELLLAFRRAFAGRDDVVLRLRTEPGFTIRRVFGEAGVARDDPQIQILERSDLPTEEFAAYYSEVHCTVHPSRSEGFGLIPFQSIACETPVIAPATTGMADYLDADNAMLLRASGATVKGDVYYNCGSQPVIDEDHLVELLCHAEAEWEHEYARVRAVAPAFRKRYTWTAALREFLSLMKDLAELPDAPARRELIAARVA